MEDKTIIAIVAMAALMITLFAIMFAPGENIDLKITLAVAIVAMIGTLTAYSYGVEKREHQEAIAREAVE